MSLFSTNWHILSWFSPVLIYSTIAHIYIFPKALFNEFLCITFQPNLAYIYAPRLCICHAQICLNSKETTTPSLEDVTHRQLGRGEDILLDC